jgi:small conductance mechanosensitive channel
MMPLRRTARGSRGTIHMSTNALTSLDQAKQTLVDLAIRFGPKVLTATVIMVAGFFFSRWVVNMVQSWLAKVDMEPPVRQLLLRLVRLGVLILFLLLALQNLDVQLLPLIAGLGVAGAGIAFAMQGVLGNLFAGLMIIFTKPFRVGEYVEIVGVYGQVIAVELFNTTLVHADQSRIVIPNRKLVGEIMHNYGQMRQLDLSVGVAYSSDASQVLTVVKAILEANPRVLSKPAPVVGIALLADSSITVAVKPWVKVEDYGPVQAEVYQAILERFRELNIQIPFPQREVRLLNG